MVIDTAPTELVIGAAGGWASSASPLIIPLSEAISCNGGEGLRVRGMEV